MTVEEAEVELRAALDKAIDMGWTPTPSITVINSAKKCCAYGAWLVVNGHAENEDAGIQFAIDEFVAHAGPGRFFGRDNFDAVFFVKPKHGCHDNRCAIGQRNKANPDFFFFRLIAARRPDLRGLPQ